MTASRWQQDNGELQRIFEFVDFVEAFGFVTQVALLAQRRNHHPDISISWNKVTITSTSHDANHTVTGRDHDLADAIDQLL